jgi:hypothetical protein
MKDIIKKLELASFSEVNEKKSSEFNVFIFEKEINPQRIYIYLHARFGKSNGMMSLFREESSDGGLFHWHYTLKYNNTIIHIMCATYRLEVFMPTLIAKDKETCKVFLNYLVRDTKNYISSINTIRDSLENWTQIINPFEKLKSQINALFYEVDKISEKIDSINKCNLKNRNINSIEFEKWAKLIDESSVKSFSIRCMIPIYIETFINLILYVGSPDEVKNSTESLNLIIRKKIHERVLHINDCTGIQNQISISDNEWKDVHKIFNNRNDLLHGNINIKKLKYNEVSFINNMPLFKSFSSFEEEFLKNSYYEYKEVIEKEIEIAERFFYYVLLSFEMKVGKEIKSLLTSYSLGFNEKTKRFGILFPNEMVDYYLVPENTIIKKEQVLEDLEVNFFSLDWKSKYLYLQKQFKYYFNKYRNKTE